MKLRAGTKTLHPFVALIAATLLMGQGLDNGSPGVSPSADEATPAVDTLPTAVNPEVPSATVPAPDAPAPQVKGAATTPAATPSAAAPKKQKAAKPAKTEVLPWTNAANVPSAVDPQASAVAAATMAQCAPLFEASCRETATCAWVADIKQEDGSTLSAHCVGRGTAPPKKGASAKPKPKPKPEAAAAAQEAGAPGAAPIVVTAPAAAQ